MQNKDLVSCYLSYSANAKTASLPYLNCESKVNVKKTICQYRRCFMRLQVVTFAQGLCSYLEFIQWEYSSYSFSRAPKQFGLFVQCNKFLLMVTCTLLCVRRLNFAQQLSYQLPLVCQLIVRSPSANLCMLVLLLIGFPKYQKFESKNKNIDWFKSFTNLGHL